MTPTDAAGGDAGEPAGEYATWPPGASLGEADSVAATCRSCDLDWRIHRALASYRLRCRCGHWLAVPALPAPSPRIEGPGAPPKPSADGGALLPASAAQHFPLAPPPEFAGIVASDGAPLEPDPDGSWTLRHASNEVRQRWTTRAMVELCLTVAAFWVPALILQLSTVGTERALYMPMAVIAASLLSLVVAQSHAGYATEGLRATRGRYFFEAILATAAFVLIAFAWIALIEDTLPSTPNELAALRGELGVTMTLLIVALCPGIFEEIAFRGLVQGRLSRLMGVPMGILVSGAAFALAHGVTLGFPLHMGIGVYLGYLRARCGSLLPGMLLHIGYNGTLVVAT